MTSQIGANIGFDAIATTRSTFAAYVEANVDLDLVLARHAPRARLARQNQNVVQPPIADQLRTKVPTEDLWARLREGLAMVPPQAVDPRSVSRYAEDGAVETKCRTATPTSRAAEVKQPVEGLQLGTTARRLHSLPWAVPSKNI